MFQAIFHTFWSLSKKEKGSFLKLASKMFYILNSFLSFFLGGGSFLKYFWQPFFLTQPFFFSLSLIFPFLGVLCHLDTFQETGPKKCSFLQFFFQQLFWKYNFSLLHAIIRLFFIIYLAATLAQVQFSLISALVGSVCKVYGLGHMFLVWCSPNINSELCQVGVKTHNSSWSYLSSLCGQDIYICGWGLALCCLWQNIKTFCEDLLYIADIFKSENYSVRRWSKLKTQREVISLPSPWNSTFSTFLIIITSQVTCSMGWQLLEGKTTPFGHCRFKVVAVIQSLFNSVFILYLLYKTN